MNAWLCSLVVSLALLPASIGAPVLVYSGTGKQVGDSASILAGPVKRFVLIDPATNSVAFITFFERQKQKIMALSGPLSYRRVSLTLPSGKTSFVYSRATVTENDADFTHFLRTIRGTQTGLKVESDALVPFLHPRVLSGIDFFSGVSGSDVKSAELRSTVTFNQKRTIQANDADQIIDQVFEAIVADLQAKGFTLLP